jgi:hypothetical protein
MNNIKKPSQIRTIQAATPRKAPVAPPVYRPQPVPHVLQRKARPGAVQMPVNRSPIIQLAHEQRGRPRDRNDPRDVAARRERSHAPSPRARSSSPLPSRSPSPIASHLPVPPSPPVLAPPPPPRLSMSSSSSSVAPPPSPPRSGKDAVEEVDVDSKLAAQEEQDDPPSIEPGGAELEGFTSMAIFRMMPKGESEQVLKTGIPQVHGHFWSSTKEYIAKYMKAGGRASTSEVLIMIPLTQTFHYFLDQAAKKRQLHAHNLGKAWEKYFSRRGKVRGGKGVISVKNDGGTATIIFSVAPPEYLMRLMGRPQVTSLD